MSSRRPIDHLRCSSLTAEFLLFIQFRSRFHALIPLLPHLRTFKRSVYIVLSFISPLLLRFLFAVRHKHCTTFISCNVPLPYLFSASSTVHSLSCVARSTPYMLSSPHSFPIETQHSSQSLYITPRSFITLAPLHFHSFYPLFIPVASSLTLLARCGLHIAFLCGSYLSICQGCSLLFSLPFVDVSSLPVCKSVTVNSDLC